MQKQEASQSKGESKKLSSAEVLKVAQNAGLVVMELKQCEFSIDKAALKQRGAGLSIEVNNNTNLVAVEPAAFQVEATTQIGGRLPGGSDDYPLRIKLVWTIVYTLSEPASAEAVLAFVAGSSMVHAWPYTRELVQSMTLRMGLPPLVLPVMFLGNTPQAQSGPAER